MVPTSYEKKINVKPAGVPEYGREMYQCGKEVASRVNRIITMNDTGPFPVKGDKGESIIKLPIITRLNRILTYPLK